MLRAMFALGLQQEQANTVSWGGFEGGIRGWAGLGLGLLCGWVSKTGTCCVGWWGTWQARLRVAGKGGCWDSRRDLLRKQACASSRWPSLHFHHAVQRTPLAYLLLHPSPAAAPCVTSRPTCSVPAPSRACVLARSLPASPLPTQQIPFVADGMCNGVRFGLVAGKQRLLAADQVRQGGRRFGLEQVEGLERGSSGCWR